MDNASNRLINLSKEIKSTSNEGTKFSVGDIIDVRNINRDFRKFFCKVRKENSDGNYLVEFLDGTVREISLINSKKVSNKIINRFKEVLQNNVDKGSITGPTVDKMIKKIEYWIKKGNKD